MYYGNPTCLSIPSIWDLILKHEVTTDGDLGIFVPFQSPQYGIWFWNTKTLLRSSIDSISFNPLNMGFDSETLELLHYGRIQHITFQSPQYGIWFWNCNYRLPHTQGGFFLSIPSIWDLILKHVEKTYEIDKLKYTFNPLNMGFDSETALLPVSLQGHYEVLSIPSIWDLILKQDGRKWMCRKCKSPFNPLNMGFDSETSLSRSRSFALLDPLSIPSIWDLILKHTQGDN